jgi:hypothetical protein
MELVLGAYNMSEKQLHGIQLDPLVDKWTIDMLSPPITSLGHVLYLESNISNVVGVNKYLHPVVDSETKIEYPQKSEYKTSVAFKYVDFIYPG